MITISNLAMQFGGSVLFKNADLQFLPAQTAPENPPF